MKRTYLTLLLCAACASPKGAVPASDQRTYPTPEAAVSALAKATAEKDREEIKHIFGPDIEYFLSGDPVQDALDFKVFSDMLAQAHRLEKRAEGGYFLCIGRKDWPFAVPLIESEKAWFFDAVTGEEELLNRRIGRNELKAIATCRAWIEAQADYLKQDWDGDGIREYAQKARSDPGERNGLYWEASGGEMAPLALLVDEARAEGYDPRGDTEPRPYHGYFFISLTHQGAHAPGGPKEYIVKGNMTRGCALLATPVIYGNSGVMSFLIGVDGKLYQKDLGEKPTESRSYDPDPSWTLVE